MVQWVRIYLAMQGTQVRSMIQEDPTCLGGLKPKQNNYWDPAPEPESHNYGAHTLQLLKPMCLEDQALQAHVPGGPSSASPCAWRTKLCKPMCLEDQALQAHVLGGPKPQQWDAWAPQQRTPTHSPHLEKASGSNEDPARPKTDN